MVRTAKIGMKTAAYGRGAASIREIFIFDLIWKKYFEHYLKMATDCVIGASPWCLVFLLLQLFVFLLGSRLLAKHLPAK